MSLPNVTEYLPNEERMQIMNDLSQKAAEYFGLSLENDTPQHIMSIVHDGVIKLKKEEALPFTGEEDADLLLGSLWGSQLIRAFGWQWVDVIFHDHQDSAAMGVMSPDRSKAVYPFHFIFGCVENKATVTILLAFNMLTERMADFNYEPKSYTNVMDYVRYAIPPEE